MLVFGNNGTNEIRFGNTIAGGAGKIYVNNTADYSSNTDGTLALSLLAGGNVGIGVPDPIAKLDVNGDILTSGNLMTQ